MRAFLLALALLSACDDDGQLGGHGGACYGNHTCNEGRVCVWWNGRPGSSICVKYDDLNIAGMMPAKACDCENLDMGGSRKVWR